jgi:hypothetical protein
MKINISKEWLFVLLWSAFVVLLANIPYIYGYAIAPQDKVFMGDARCFIDTNTYLAWMHQAKDGHILFKDIYTTEPHERMLFHPLFLALGNISRLSGLSLITVHSLARIVFGFFLLIFCYKFISLFFEHKFERSLAFILVSVSGGFGWLKLFSGINAIPEVWFLTGWVEGNTFMSIYSLPLFSASVLMLIAVFYLMLKSFELQKLSYAVWAGIVCSLLVTTHFFDALIVYPALVLYIAALYLISGDASKLRANALSFAVMFFISLPSPLYNFWASMANPVFHEHAWKGAITLSPGFMWFLGLFGILIPLAAIGATSVLFDRKNPLFLRRLFLVIWALAVPFLIYSPISFQRRLIEGAHIPISILAAMALIFICRRLKLDARITSAAMIALLIPGNLALLSNDMNYLKSNSSQRSVAGFLDRDIYDAMKWLEANTARDDVVLADFEIGNYVPAVSGNTVFIGHSPETINFWEKWDLVKRFFSADSDDNYRREFLRASGVKYIIYSWKERLLGGFDPGNAPYLKRVYENSSTSIFEVDL